MDTPGTNTSTERLMADLQAVVRDTENLLKATAGDASERAPRRRHMPAAAPRGGRVVLGPALR